MRAHSMFDRFLNAASVDPVVAYGAQSSQPSRWP